MFSLLKNHYKLLRKNFRHMFLFELAYKIMATAIIYPLVLLALNYCFKIAGIKYLTNEYIVKLLSNPGVILILFCLLLGVCIYTIYEMIFISSAYEFDRRRENVSFMECILSSLRKMKLLLHIKHLPWFLFALLSFIALNVTIIINFFISGTSANLLNAFMGRIRWWMAVLILILIVAIYVPVILGIFSMNIFVLENNTYKKAYIKSIALVKKNWVKILLNVVFYNLVVLFAIGVLYFVISAVLVAGVKILDMAYMGNAIYLSELRIIRGGVKLLSVYLALPLSYTVISSLYYKLYDEENIDYEPIDIDEPNIKRNKKIFLVALAISIVLNTTYVVASFNDNPFDKVAIFSGVQVTSHRGDSKSAPENTMAAFQLAMDNMTDYIELDVQQTKDGEIVVMHDVNAYRTTGVDRNIYDMTMEEVSRLDAASFFSEKYAGEPVPTLREVIELVKGRAKLNIEIKANSHNPTLEETLVSIINEYDFASECVVTSFDYNSLKKVKSYNENIEIGYILSVAYGEFYNMDDVDFFSINASFLSKRTVDAIHNSGKQVHAWTVNNETAIKNLANKGVDNIITDDPVTAKEVIYSRNTSETVINMIKYVFNR